MKNKNYKNFRTKHMPLTIFLAAFAMGCAHTPHLEPNKQEEFEQKLSNEPALENYEDFRKEAEATVANSDGITADQKAKLIDLKVDTAKKMDAIQKEILKLKGALIKNIVADRYQAKEVLLAESKIEKLSKHKLKIFFSALEKGNKILGKTNAKEQILYDLKLERESRVIRDWGLDR